MSKRITGLVFLLIGVAVGVGAAQVLPGLEPSSFLNTGLFTVNSGEGVSFHASLDDRRGGLPATVMLRLVDDTGAVVARRDVVLGPGQSATLQYLKPGRLRAHAGIVEGDTAGGRRRIVLGTVEIFSLRDATAAGLLPASLRSARFAEPEILRFVCSMNDGGGNGRLPD
jgi:hypothetical protein